MKYIIDVTQLVHWPGHLTGIPRVVQELAVRFPSDDRSAVFVSWVKELGRMCEVDLGRTLAVRGNGIEYVKEGKASTQSISLKSSEEIIISQRPSFVRKAKNLTKRGVSKLKLDDSRVVKALREKMYVQSLSEYKVVHPKKNDIFFIGAGEWWDQNFIDLVKSYAEHGVKVVQISHDMLPIVAPQFSGHATESLSNYNRQIMPIASLVLANSQSTKRDIVSWFKAQKLTIPPIEVFRIGEDFALTKSIKPQGEDFKSAKVKGGDYILCVGTIEARKNHAILYYTYKLAQSRGVKLPKLLIVGRRGWKTDDIYEYITTDPATKDRITPLLSISDEELTWLYDNCLFNIYPSQYEGWGMPIAESLMRGVPCIASNTSSMPEVAPNHAKYFNPNSTDELLDAIIDMLKPGQLAKEKAAIKSYQPTTWDESFSQVFNYLEKL